MADVELRVRGLTAPICCVSARTDWTVHDVSVAIQEAAGILVQEQRLFLGKLPLKDLKQRLEQLPLDGAASVEISLLRPDHIFCDFIGVCSVRVTALHEVERATLVEAQDLCSELVGCKGFVFREAEEGDVLTEVRFFSKPPLCQFIWSPGRRGDLSICFRCGQKEAFKPVVDMILETQGRVLHQPRASWLRSHRGVMLALAEQRGLSLRHASDELRGDRELAAAAVFQSEDAIPYVAPPLWRDPEFVGALVRQQGQLLRHASEVLRAEREVVIPAVQQDGHALQHAAKKLRSDREVVAAAVGRHPEALSYASDKLRADPEFVLELAGRSPHALTYAADKLRSDPEFILPLVRRDESLLQYASDSLRADRNFILKIVERQGDAVRHAWPSMWEDGEVILAAGRQDKRAMRHAGRAAWSNREFVLTMVRKNWRELRHASEEVKADREIAKLAITQNPEALQYVSASLKEDPEVVFLAYQQDESAAVRFASAVVFAERDFVLAMAGVKVPPEWVLA